MSEMGYPMQCLRCMGIHDAANVTVVQRYADCSTWRCPKCGSLIDDRPQAAGGSARRVETDFPIAGGGIFHG